MNKFAALFVFFLLSFSVVQGQDGVTAGAAWQVTKYDITANLPSAAGNRALSAKATLNLRNVGRGAGATVTLRINPKADVVAAQVAGVAANVRKTSDDKLGAFQRFTVSLPTSVQPNGTVAVTVEYKLTVTENTGLTAVSSVGSQFLPLALWYPTPTNPYSPRGADSAPFKLQVTAPNGERIVSSGKGGPSTFEQNLNAQPFFVTGEWDGVETPDQAVTDQATGPNYFAYIPKGSTEAEKKQAIELLRLTEEAHKYIVSLIGSGNRGSYNLVAVRRGAGFADSGTILIDANVLRRSKLDSATVLLIAESVAKTSLSNVTSVRGDGYGAIQEGLARFVATQFIEKQFGREVAEVERQRQRTSFVAVAKRDAPISQTSPADITYFASTANKGAMIWRLIAREMGADKFFSAVRAQLTAANTEGLTLKQLRDSLETAGGEKVKAILAYGFDQITDTDLIIGLPQASGAETKAALRNAGSLPVTVNVVATTEKGEKLNSIVNLAEKSFGEAVFKTSAKISRVEIDAEKFYPQIDFSNDGAPRDIAENDWSAALAISFNRQEFSKVETLARKMLAVQPRYDETRTWLGRALLEQSKIDEAEKEFTAALAEKLPTAKTLAWANIGLGEIALRRNQDSAAVKFFDGAVRADAEYASNLAARQGRVKAESSPTADEAAKTFFAVFDKAVLTARKAEVESYILGGELTKFSGGITGNQPEVWQTKVLRSEQLDTNRLAVDVVLNVKIINQEAKSGTALFTLVKTPAGWKLASTLR